MNQEILNLIHQKVVRIVLLKSIIRISYVKHRKKFEKLYYQNKNQKNY